MDLRHMYFFNSETKRVTRFTTRDDVFVFCENIMFKFYKVLKLF